MAGENSTSSFRSATRVAIALTSATTDVIYAHAQETIAEFQVLTTGYKAEFGQASGAIINVITKTGGNAFHGVGSLFYRSNVFDASNSLDPNIDDALPLSRFDYSVALGGR